MTSLTSLFAFHVAALLEQYAGVRAFARLVLLTMFSLAPLDAPRLGHESAVELRARYGEISLAIASAAWRPDPVQARYRAAILLGIARHESGLFELDVDTGPCTTAAAGCDGGRSVSVFQLLVKGAEDRRWFQHHRESAAARALQIALGSISSCPHAPFARYASGSCEQGLEAAAELQLSVASAHRRIEHVARLDADPYAN